MKGEFPLSWNVGVCMGGWMGEWLDSIYLLRTYVKQCGTVKGVLLGMTHKQKWLNVYACDGSCVVTTSNRRKCIRNRKRFTCLATYEFNRNHQRHLVKTSLDIKRQDRKRQYWDKRNSLNSATVTWCNDGGDISNGIRACQTTQQNNQQESYNQIIRK